MAQINYQSWKLDLDTKIYENTNGEVTATNVNQILTDLGSNVLWSIAMQSTQAITTTPVAVVFTTPMPSAVFQLNIRCYDADGENVDYTITDVTVNGFTVTGATAGFIDYLATHI